MNAPQRDMAEAARHGRQEALKVLALGPMDPEVDAYSTLYTPAEIQNHIRFYKNRAAYAETDNIRTAALYLAEVFNRALGAR